MDDQMVVPIAVGLMLGMVLGWLAPLWLSTTIILLLIYSYRPKSEPWAQDFYNDTVRSMNRRW